MYTKIYDDLFEGAVRAYWVECPDWRYLKAQGIAESALDPNAVSEVNAQGLMQFMRDTWRDWAARLNFPAEATPFMPKYAIPAGAAYMADRWRAWNNPRRARMDRLRLAWASYNAGFGHLLAAQSLANGALEFDRIMAKLPAVTGEVNAHETSTYVANILAAYAKLIAEKP